MHEAKGRVMWKFIFVLLLLLCANAKAALYDDTTFGNVGYVDVEIGGSQYYYDAPELVVLPDRRIVAATLLSGQAPRVPTLRIVRLLANGDRDPSFGSDGIATVVLSSQAVDWAYVTALVPLDDGRLYVLGYTMRIENPPDGSGQTYHQLAHLLRLRGDGSVDPEFNGGAPWSGDPLFSSSRLLVRSNGIVLVALSGYCCSGATGFEARALRGDGTPDPAFGIGGALSVPPAESASVGVMGLPGGGFQILHLVRPSATQSLRNYWRRYRPDGSVDTSYGNAGVQDIPLVETFGMTALHDVGDGTQLGVTSGCAMRSFDAEGRVLRVLPSCTVRMGLSNSRVQRYGEKWLFSGEERFGGVPPPTDGTYLHVTDRSGRVDEAFATPQWLRWRPPDAPTASYGVAADGDAHIVIVRGYDEGIRIRRYRDLRGSDPLTEPVPALAPAVLVLLGGLFLLLARRHLRAV